MGKQREGTPGIGVSRFLLGVPAQARTPHTFVKCQSVVSSPHKGHLTSCFALKPHPVLQPSWPCALPWTGQMLASLWAFAPAVAPSWSILLTVSSQQAHTCPSWLGSKSLLWGFLDFPREIRASLAQSSSSTSQFLATSTSTRLTCSCEFPDHSSKVKSRIITCYINVRGCLNEWMNACMSEWLKALGRGEMKGPLQPPPILLKCEHQRSPALRRLINGGFRDWKWHRKVIRSIPVLLGQETVVLILWMNQRGWSLCPKSHNQYLAKNPDFQQRQSNHHQPQ